MSKLRDRTVELQQQIDQFNRENKQADDEARKLNLQSQDQLNQLNDKNKQVEDYNSSLGMGGGVEQKLKQQLDELKKEKLKLEALSKQYDEDIKEYKQKVEVEELKATELDRQKKVSDEKLKELSYKLQNSARDKQMLEEKTEDAMKTFKETDAILKQLTSDIQQSTNDDSQKGSQISNLQGDLEDLRRKLDSSDREKKNIRK